MHSLLPRLALVVLFSSFGSLACSAATGGEDELVGEDEEVVEREGEHVTGSVPSGSTLRATSHVNLRSGPGTGYKILKVIPNGASVTVVSGTPSGSWYNVRYAGITGWSHGAYFDRVGSSPPPSGGGGGGCHSQLSALGLSWKDSGAVKGIPDPVTVSSPIRGVSFRYVGSSSSAPILGNCAFFVKLAAAADKMKAWGVSEFTHIGTYNYRVISGTSKLSQHAYGNAIDIAGFRAGGTYYSLANNSHFVKNTSSPTCSQARTTPGDKLFKGWACDTKAAGIFNVILTPNYNAAHRDHFHVDITPGGNFIKAQGDEWSGTGFDSDTVDPFSFEPLGDGFDVHEYDDVDRDAFDREIEIQKSQGVNVASFGG